MTYPNYVFSIFAFTGFVLVSIPLPWHLEAWNTGTCLYIVWTSLACLNQFINSVVWNGNAINWAPVWCDISSRLMVGTAVAIPAASLCINRRLYHIACVQTVTVTKAEKRRAIMVDLAIGIGLPVLEMVLQYIPQGHRFNIFEDVGCYPFTYNTWVAYLLVSCPPVAIGCVSAVYAVLSIRAFNKRRSQFNKLLSANSNLNSNRYFRLMCLAGIEIICTVPLGSYAIYLNSTAGVISPWKSWADTHSGFSRVDQFPSILWRAHLPTEISIELSRWLILLCAFVFFGFFGFADEAMKHYRIAIVSVAKRVGLSTASMNSGMSSSTGDKSRGMTGSKTIPVFVRRGRRDSFDSFSDLTSITDSGAFNNEKSFVPSTSFGGLSLADVGGTLGDYKADEPYTPSSPSTSSSSSLPSPATKLPQLLPESTVTRPEPVLDISTVRRSTSFSTKSPVTPSVPEPALNTNVSKLDSVV